MLNQRQELFIQNVLTGKSKTESAKLAGYSEKTSYSIGQRLLKNVEIQQRLSELQLATTDGTIATVSRRKEMLTNIADTKLVTSHTSSDRIRAIAELNKMEGDYAPEKHAVLGDIEITIIHKDK